MIQLDYGFTYKEAMEQCESLLQYFEDQPEMAMEAQDQGVTRVDNQTVKPAQQTMTSMAKKSMAQDQAKNSNQIQKTSEDPQELLKQFDEKVKTIQDAKSKVGQRLTALVMTTKEGNQEFLKAVNANAFKLQNAITVINWTYAHDPTRYLHPKVLRTKMVLEKNLQYLTGISIRENPKDSVLNMNRQELEESVLRQIGAPSTTVKYSQFVAWTQGQFRGKKAERQLDSTDAKLYLRQMQAFEKIDTQLKKDLNDADALINRLRTARQYMVSSRAPIQEKQSILSKMNRIGKLFVMYLNMLQMMYRLHVEYVLNRRAILRRLYQK